VKHVRYIVKSVWEHASVGLSKDSVLWASSSEELRTAVQGRKPFLGDDAFAEAYIDGREFNVAMLANTSEPEVLPPAEIRFDAFPEDKLKIVDYYAKWEVDSFEYHQTPRRFIFPEEDAQLLCDLRKLARQCWQLFGLRGYARIDFRVDEAQQPYVLEINTNPCLSPDAGFLAAAEQAELSVVDVVQRIIQEIA
jgi:D-alanine-D-alanine ligase